MSSFTQRDQIDRVLHPELLWADKPILPLERPIWEIMDAPYQGDKVAGATGEFGTATRHITGHYEDTLKGPYDPTKSVGTLDTKAERYRALNEMTQQQAGGFDAEAMCGADVLLAGSILAGGGAGVGTLIDAVEKFKKGNSKGKLDEETLKQFAQLDELKKKIARGKELTAGDLTMVAGDVFNLMQTPNRDGSDAKGGLKDKDVNYLMATSPELRKLFKDNDLSYDSIDVTGSKQGTHAVLGIGHARDDKDHTGAHAAVYDPTHRTTRDFGEQQKLQDAEDKVKHAEDIYGKGSIQWMVAMQEKTGAMVAEKMSHHEAGQLITDPTELKNYQQATYKSVEFNGDDLKGDDYNKSGIHFRRFTPANIYQGQY